RTNSTVNTANSSFTIENPTGSQSMEYFTFNNAQKGSIRVDVNGNVFLNSASSNFFLDNDFGSLSPTITPNLSPLIIAGALKVSQSNSTATTSTLTVDNSTGSQSLQSFVFANVPKGSIRVDSTGNVFLNSASGLFTLNNDLGSAISPTLAPTT